MTEQPMCVGVRQNGPPKKFWIAQISHAFVNGHHTFTSKAENISGLFIAETDPKKALAQLAPTIQHLIFLNLGQKVDVFLGGDFDDFEREHCDTSEDDMEAIKDTFAVIKRAA